MPVKTRISRSAWPWGRMSPAQRIRDLRAMIAIERVNESTDQRALNVELRELLAETKSNSSAAGEGNDDLDAFFTT